MSEIKFAYAAHGYDYAGAIERWVNIIGVLEEEHIVLYIAESPRKMLCCGACGAVSEDVDIPAGSQ